METLKELFSKQNRSTSIKLITYPLIWFVIFYVTIYSIAWLDYNVFY